MSIDRFLLKDRTIYYLMAWYIIFERKLSAANFEGRITPEIRSRLWNSDALHREMYDTFSQAAGLSEEDQQRIAAIALILQEGSVQEFLDSLDGEKLGKIYALFLAQDDDPRWNPERMLRDFAGDQRIPYYLLVCKIYNQNKVSTDDYKSIDEQKLIAVLHRVIELEECGLCIFSYAADMIDAVTLGELPNLPQFKLRYLYFYADQLIETETPAQLLARLDEEAITLLYLLLTCGENDA